LTGPHIRSIPKGKTYCKRRKEATMPEVTRYPAGTPSWADLGTPDVDTSVRFYQGLFGWSIEEAGDPELTGGYRMAMLRDKAVAGIGPIMNEGQPPAWTTYITVDDADKTAAQVAEAGGQALFEPMDVLTVGRMGMFLDPTGSAFAVWQPRDHIGAGLVNEAGAMCWNELATRDAEAAKAFYSQVFGWTWEGMPMDGITYWMFQVDGRVVGGVVTMDENWPAEVPAHWMVYFNVDDCDASAAKAAELGGSVSVPPTDIPVGRFAVINDPHGAVFSMIKLEQADPGPG
jgi:predicted enzyme related to lactoylglutathione lyase